jgi:hypothetical protein
MANRFDLLTQQQLQSCCGHLAESLKQLIVEADALQGQRKLPGTGASNNSSGSGGVGTNDLKASPTPSSPSTSAKPDEQISMDVNKEAKAAAIALHKVKQFASTPNDGKALVEAIKEATTSTSELLHTSRSLGLSEQSER